MSAQWGITDADSLNIMKFIAQNDYCGIAAPTGSGKSTRLVAAINKIGANCKVYVVEPTIPAVETLHSKMSGELGNDHVGKAADSVVSYNEKHKIVYMTAGHMRRKLLSYFRDGKYFLEKAFCDVLIIDEAHSGSIDNDAIMALWNTAYKAKCPVPRLVLLSATLDVGSTPFPDAKFFTMESSGFPVDVTYSEKSYKPGEKKLYVDMAAHIISEHYRLPLSETDPGESWLVFCAGSYEVGVVVDEISKRNIDRVTTVTAYAEADQAEREKIFAPREPGHRVIIVGTNYIEASITIADAVYEFDSGDEKYGETSDTGGMLLVTDRISQSSAKQRKGRVGRTKPGRVHRMYTKEDFEKMKPQRSSEISRVPIHSTIMELLKVGLSPQTVFKDRITDGRLARTIDKLHELEMVTDRCNVTPKGDFAPDFSISIEGAAILWEWIETGKPLFPAISAISLIESYNPSYFRYPAKTAQNASIHSSLVEEVYDTHFEQYNAQSDIEALLKFWNKFMNDVSFVRPDNREYRKWYSKVNKWCDSNSIRRNKMRDCIRNVNLMINTLSRKGHSITLGGFTPEGCLNVLTPILRNVYRRNLFVYRNHGYWHADERYKLEARNPITRRQGDSANLIIGLIHRQVKSNDGYINRIITLFHPLDDGSKRDASSSSPAPILSPQSASHPLNNRGAAKRTFQPPRIPFGASGWANPPDNIPIPTFDMEFPFDYSQVDRE